MPIFGEYLNDYKPIYKEMIEDNFACNFIEDLEVDIFAIEKMKNINLFVIIAWNKE